MSTKINVFGLGRVGLITAFTLAARGHDINAVDIDPSVVDQLNSGIDPLDEPGFTELLTQYKDQLSFSNKPDLTAAAHFVCVPTHFLENNNGYDLSNVNEVLHQLTSEPGLLVLRSTVAPGTCREISLHYPHLNVVYMPEFFREGEFVNDSKKMEQFVFAGKETSPVRVLFDLKETSVEACRWEEAEVLKMSSNLFHGLKVSFANEIGRLATKHEADPQRVMEMFCKDRDSNLSARYLKPGFAYGGPCLVKDISAFIAQDDDHLGLSLSAGVVKSNFDHLKWVSAKIALETKGTILFLGGSFKVSGKSFKDSPVLHIAKILKERGIKILAIESDFANAASETLSLSEALSRADLIVHGNYPWTTASIDQVVKSSLPIFDLLSSPLPSDLTASNKVSEPYEPRN